MQETDSTLAPDTPSQPRSRRSRIRRFVAIYYILLALLLLAIIPPLISVNRYQRKIATSIGQSLGRTVTLDNVSLNLLPLPGFTIKNLVVSEDPAFGNEPIIRANTVRVNLRVLPLWHRKVEVSSISFTEPSVNLVHLSNGKWNLQSILIQAAHIQTAPTAQKAAGPAPRFPYIEATGARVNLKLDQEKLPISLSDADFALWLPTPQEWRLRIETHPIRTDSDVSDTGTLRIEGTLGRAASLTQVPLSLDADWSGLPLGNASRLLFGHDLGLRGNMTLTAHAKGTVGDSGLQARLRFDSVRRADFVPPNPIDLDLRCHAVAGNSFHAFTGVQCALPGDPAPLLLEASIPDIRDLDSSSARIISRDLPLATITSWLRAASPRIPQDLSAHGTLLGGLEISSGLNHLRSQWQNRLDASLHLSNMALQSAQASLPSTTFGDLILQDVPSATSQAAAAATAHLLRVSSTPAPPPSGLILNPTPVSLGGKDPAMLEGHIDAAGYTLHLTGMVLLSRLVALGKAIPQLGDGLAAALPTNRAPGPVRIDLTATRPWGGPQIWQDTSPHPAPVRPRRRRR